MPKSLSGRSESSGWRKVGGWLRTFRELHLSSCSGPASRPMKPLCSWLGNTSSMATSTQKGQPCFSHYPPGVRKHPKKLRGLE